MAGIDPMKMSAATLVLATNNQGKVREIAQILAGTHLEVVPQGQFGVPEAEETGLTFVENAILKARNAARHTGLAAIADDSGLEVDALAGAPGIYSARYAGVDVPNEAHLDKLLDALAGVPEGARGARFQCFMVYLRHANDPTPVICQGTWEGAILAAPRGSGGFGYDPLFATAMTDNAGAVLSAAELAPEVKNRLSHRGQALAQLRARLTAYLKSESQS